MHAWMVLPTRRWTSRCERLRSPSHEEWHAAQDGTHALQRLWRSPSRDTAALPFRGKVAGDGKNRDNRFNVRATTRHLGVFVLPGHDGPRVGIVAHATHPASDRGFGFGQPGRCVRRASRHDSGGRFDRVRLRQPWLRSRALQVPLRVRLRNGRLRRFLRPQRPTHGFRLARRTARPRNEDRPAPRCHPPDLSATTSDRLI